MPLYSIVTQEYDADMTGILSKRLKENGFDDSSVISRSDKKIEIEIKNDKELRALSRSLCTLLENDLCYFELAHIINGFPFELEDKREILKKAAEKSGNFRRETDTAGEIYEYLKENRLIVPEGYLHFMMQDTFEHWRVCSDIAAEEILLEKEQKELIKLLGMYTELTESGVEKLTVVLHPDGSSTLTDNDKIRIDCNAESIDGMLSMLIGISPRKIVIYDLSCGQCEKLKETVILLFGERVSCYNRV